MTVAKLCLSVGLLLVVGLPFAIQGGSDPGFVRPGRTEGGALNNSADRIGLAAGTGFDRVQPMCPAVFEFEGEAAFDQFGYSAAGAGDVDADGYGDVIVGGLGNDGSYVDAGRVYIYSGLTGDQLGMFSGEAEGDFFGNSVASAGDVNGDGFADMIVGAPWNDAGGVDAGRAYVFSGQTGEILYVFTGEGTDDWLGWAVASAGDVDADGYDDVIIGAPQNSSGELYAGRAYVFSGQTGDTLHVFTGELGVDCLGTSVASAGDVDGDGYADVIVGAYLYGATNTGRAYVFSGQTGDTLHVFTGEGADDRFGWSVASAGDVDGDTSDDVMVGAPRNDAAGIDAGKVYVYSGQTGSIIYTFTGGAANDQFGFSISSVGNIDGDGVDDLAIGAWGCDAGGANAGRAYVFSGSTGDTIYVVTGEADSDWLGSAVSSAGEDFALGYDDLIIGACGFDSPGPEAGRIFIYRDACCCLQRGDCDLTGTVNVADLTYLVNFLFKAGPPVHCPVHGDADGTGTVNVSDLTYLVAYLFKTGPAPAACP